MKKIFYLLLLSVLPATLYSQQYFAKNDMEADLDTMYLYIQGIHPDMYIFTAKVEFEKNSTV